MVGGAPRDWYRGEPCNDVDIYIQTNKHTQKLISKLKRMFKDVTERIDEYDGQKFIHYIVDIPFDVTIMQLIFVKDISVDEVIGRFGCSLSQILWEPSTDTYQTTQCFRFDLKENYISFYRTNQYRWCNDMYLKKMTERFPERMAFIEDSDVEDGRIMSLNSYLKNHGSGEVKPFSIFDDTITF